MCALAHEGGARRAAGPRRSQEHVRRSSVRARSTSRSRGRSGHGSQEPRGRNLPQPRVPQRPRRTRTIAPQDPTSRLREAPDSSPTEFVRASRKPWPQSPGHGSWIAAEPNGRELFMSSGVAPEGPRRVCAVPGSAGSRSRGRTFRPSRRRTAALSATWVAGFAPVKFAAELRLAHPWPDYGEIAQVDYGQTGLLSLLTSGLGHGTYTRLDAMLFHSRLVADRLYGPKRAA